jgi:hypothetical protein
MREHLKRGVNRLYAGYGLPLTIVVGLVVWLPALFYGFRSDDFLLLSGLDGWDTHESSLANLYRISSGDVATVARGLASGRLPWWTHPEFKIALCRPLACLLLALDHALFGINAIGYHFHSLVWYGLLVAAGRPVFKQLLPPTVATTALLIFVVDDVHIDAATWIANRHSTAATALVLFGLAASLRPPSIARSSATWLLYALGLATSESAVQALLFVAALTLFNPGAPWRRRAVHTAGITTLLAVYFVAYRSLSFGVRASGIYLDVLADPGDCAKRLQLLPVALGELFVGDAPLTLGHGLLRAGVMLAGFGLIVAFVLTHEREDRTRRTRRILLGLLFGAVLSILPGLLGTPGERILLVGSVGAAAIAASAVHAFATHTGSASPIRSLGAYLACGLLLAVNLAFPVLIVLRTGASRNERLMSGALPSVVALERTLPADEPVVLVVVPGGLDVVNPWQESMLNFQIGRRRGNRWHLLSMAPCKHVLTRKSNQEFELTSDCPMLTGPFFGLFRSAKLAFHVGEEIRTDLLSIRIAEMGSSITRLVVRTRMSINDSRLHFAAWRNGALNLLAMPTVDGDSIIIVPGPGHDSPR